MERPDLEAIRQRQALVVAHPEVVEERAVTAAERLIEHDVVTLLAYITHLEEARELLNEWRAAECDPDFDAPIRATADFLSDAALAEGEE